MFKDVFRVDSLDEFFKNRRGNRRRSCFPEQFLDGQVAALIFPFRLDLLDERLQVNRRHGALQSGRDVDLVVAAFFAVLGDLVRVEFYVELLLQERDERLEQSSSRKT